MPNHSPMLPPRPLEVRPPPSEFGREFVSLTALRLSGGDALARSWLCQDRDDAKPSAAAAS